MQAFFVMLWLVLLAAVLCASAVIDDIVRDVVPPGSVVYDLGGNDQDDFLSFINLTELVGEQGSSIALTSNHSDYIKNIDALKQLNLWPRSIVVDGEHLYNNIQQDNSHIFIKLMEVFESVDKLLFHKCPTLIKLPFNIKNKSIILWEALIPSLLNKFTVKCLPTVIIAVRQDIHDNSTNSNIDVKSYLYSIISYSLFVKYEYFISEIDGYFILSTNAYNHKGVQSISLSDILFQESKIVTTTFQLDMDIFVAPFSATDQLLRLKLDWDENDAKSVLFPVFQTNPDQQILSSIYQLHCSMWFATIFSDLTNDNELAKMIWQQDFLKLVKNCKSSAIYQSELIRQQLHRQRQMDQSRFRSHRYLEVEENADKELWNKMFGDGEENKEVFSRNFQPEYCGEPIWCENSDDFLDRIERWQSPDFYFAQRDEIVEELSTSFDSSKFFQRKYKNHDLSGLTYYRGKITNYTALSEQFGANFQPTRHSHDCQRAKYLVYNPLSRIHGIGSMLVQIAAVFRFAICHGRILTLHPTALPDTLQRWATPGCARHAFECYFQPLSRCPLNASQLASAPVLDDTTVQHIDEFPLRDAQILVFEGLPTDNKCGICGHDWHDPQSNSFFDRARTSTEQPPHGFQRLDLRPIDSYTGKIKSPWQAQFLRYLVRPRPWFRKYLSQLVAYSLVSPIDRRGLPRHFISLHVRRGFKLAETDLVPLQAYMDFIKKKLPFMRDIFLSTETENMIEALIRNNPEYRIHYLDYPRVEFLNLTHTPRKRSDELSFDEAELSFAQEFLFSLANLAVAVEAHGFVGTLSSNWCVLIDHLQRTRGDGGYDYFSLDLGSFFSTCY